MWQIVLVQIDTSHTHERLWIEQGTDMSDMSRGFGQPEVLEGAHKGPAWRQYVQMPVLWQKFQVECQSSQTRENTWKIE